MKTLKIFTLGLALLAFSGIAKATGTDDDVTSKNYAINTYANAMTRGKLDGFSEVLDPTVKFSMMQGKHMSSYTKKDMLEFLEKIKNIQEDCTTSTSVLQSDTNLTIAKVDMQFNGFVRSNYVTLANTGKGWKIINVYSVSN